LRVDGHNNKPNIIVFIHLSYRYSGFPTFWALWATRSPNRLLRFSLNCSSYVFEYALSITQLKKGCFAAYPVLDAAPTEPCRTTTQPKKHFVQTTPDCGTVLCFHVVFAIGTQRYAFDVSLSPTFHYCCKRRRHIIYKYPPFFKATRNEFFLPPNATVAICSESCRWRYSLISVALCLGTNILY